MRSIQVVALGLLALCTVQACSIDLFHDTSWVTACELDPDTPGCESDAGEDVGTDAGEDPDADGGEEDVGVGVDSADDALPDLDADSSD